MYGEWNFWEILSNLKAQVPFTFNKTWALEGQDFKNSYLKVKIVI